MIYHEFTSLTLADFKELAEIASKNNCLDEFLTEAWYAIAIQRGNHHADNMTKIVNLLEDYKHSIGRRYNLTHGHNLITQYNDLEDKIRQLTATYEAKRKSKPYYLGRTCK